MTPQRAVFLLSAPAILALTFGPVLFADQGAGGARAAAAVTPDAQPNFQGKWDPDDTGASHSLELGSESRPQGRKAAMAPPLKIDALNPDGMLPYQPWAAAKREELLRRLHTPTARVDLDPEDRCLLNGVPRSNYRDNIQILQVPGYVVLLYENNHAYRVIPVDERPHVSDAIQLWNGDSRGRWEGRTLVVDVRNLVSSAPTFNLQPWFDSHGSFYSNALHVVERWTMVDNDTIEYEATVNDPKVFTRPWTVAVTMNRITDPAHEFLEEACHEGGQRNIDNMVSAGRLAVEAGRTGTHTHED